MRRARNLFRMFDVFRAKLLSTCIFPALFAAPAFAQGACGQPAELTQKLPTALSPDFAEVTLITRPLRSEPAYVEFEVTEPTELTLQTLGRGIDTVLTLYAADGRMISWDDDSAGDLDAQLGATLQPGTYCAQSRLISAEPAADAMVIVLALPGLPADPAAAEQEAIAATCADPNLTPVLAEGLVGGETQSVSGSIDPSIGSQSYRVVLDAPAQLRIDAGSPEIDTLLTVRNADGELLFENDDHPEMPGTDSRIAESFEPGSYCVTVAPYSDGTGTFTLALAAESTAGVGVSQGVRIPEAGDGAAIEELGALDGPLESKTLDRAQTLWTAFEVTDAGPVTVEGVSVTSAFTLRLFTEAGDLLRETVSSGTLASAEMAAELEPGRYLVGLTNDDTGDGLKMRQIKLRR